MATIQKRNDSYRILFVHHGKRYSLPLGKVPQGIAEAKAAKVEEALALLKGGYITLPPGTDIVAFVRHDGKPPEAAPSPLTTLGKLRDEYLRVHTGSLEDRTIDGMQLHFKHLVATLGDGFPIQTLSLGSLQQHAERRKVMKGARGKLSPATIKKELVTLRTIWNWGVGMGYVTGKFPSLKQVKMGKPDEKPPFQTYAEIERRIASGLSDKEIAELWDALFLTLPEIVAMLEYVKTRAIQPWVYPMICFAAHTGARRSEMIRSLVADVDFEAGTMLIRERKRAHDKRTTRRVPLTPFLAEVLKDWLKGHPGGRHLFCQSEEVSRSKKRSKTTGHKGKGRVSSLKGRLATVKPRERLGPGPITKDEATDHLKRTLAGSKWGVMRGWHIFRHSYASNCAAKGVDQRLLDSWLGHTTEIRKRYLHLIPGNEQQAIRSVFG